MENSPAALITLIATVAISLFALFRNQNIIYQFLLSPYRIFNNGEYYRFISSGFIHGDLVHLMFNMITFYFFAFSYESIVGTGQFVIVYFGSMILADVSTVLKKKNDPKYAALGASGAVSGLLFSMILYVPDSSIYLFFIPIPIPSPIFAILYLVYCWYAAKNAQDNINHDAHLWGALAGVLFTILLDFSTVKGFFQYIF